MGQPRGDYAAAKYKKKGSGITGSSDDTHPSLVTSSDNRHSEVSTSVELTSGGTISTNAPSITT